MSWCSKVIGRDGKSVPHRCWLRDSIDGLPKAAIKRMINNAGIKTIKQDAYDTFKSIIKDTIEDIIKYIKANRNATIEELSELLLKYCYMDNLDTDNDLIFKKNPFYRLIEECFQNIYWDKRDWVEDYPKDKELYQVIQIITEHVITHFLKEISETTIIIDKETMIYNL